MNIEIDTHSGFCYGVRKTVQLAENLLAEGFPTYCVGEIVHNAEEVKRLQDKGIIFINHEELSHIKEAVIMFRAHGESSDIHSSTIQNSNKLHDGTCPIVLTLQKKIQQAWQEMRPVNGQVVIYGKKKHAEVIGLCGQTSDKTIVIESINDISLLNLTLPIVLFSQTTQDPSQYLEIQNAIRNKMSINFKEKDIPLFIKDSICGHVSKRGEHIAAFARKHDVILFVSGKNSSNGKVLYNISKTNNPLSYWISNTKEIQHEWFINKSSIGICGATSTPQWLMEDIAENIKISGEECPGSKNS